MSTTRSLDPPLTVRERGVLAELLERHHEFGNGRDSEASYRRLEGRVRAGADTFTYDEECLLYWAFRDSAWMLRDDEPALGRVRAFYYMPSPGEDAS